MIERMYVWERDRVISDANLTRTVATVTSIMQHAEEMVGRGGVEWDQLRYYYYDDHYWYCREVTTSTAGVCHDSVLWPGLWVSGLLFYWQLSINRTPPGFKVFVEACVCDRTPQTSTSEICDRDHQFRFP